MILVDTSVWIDHLRAGDTRLTALLRDGQVLMHPWVVGELALGQLERRREILGLLLNLPQVTLASDDEVRGLIDDQRLFGRGIGWVDVHLLAAVMLTSARLWTRDKRLAAVAERLGLAPDRG